MWGRRQAIAHALIVLKGVDATVQDVDQFESLLMQQGYAIIRIPRIGVDSE